MQPRHTTGLKHCPIESFVLEVVRNLDITENAVLDIKINDVGSFTLALPLTTECISLNATEDQRNRFLMDDDLRGEFQIMFTEDGETMSRPFIISKTLYTDMFPVKAEHGIFKDAKGQGYYPEDMAYGKIEGFSIAPNRYVEFNPYLVPSQVCLKWPYTIDDKGVRSYLFLTTGYSIPAESAYIGDASFMDRKSKIQSCSLFTSCELIASEAAVFDDSDTIEADIKQKRSVREVSITFVDDTSGTRYEYDYGQSVYLMNGVSVDYDEVLKALKVAYLRLLTTNERDVEVHFELQYGHYILSKTERDYYYQYCVDNELVDAYLGSLSSSRDALALYSDEDHQTLAVAYKGSQSCFAFVLTKLFAMLTQVPMLSFYQVMNSLRRAGLLVADKDVLKNGLCGICGRVSPKSKVITPLLLPNGVSLRIKPTIYTSEYARSHRLPDGYYVMGVDKTLQTGDGPYHYILVSVRDGKYSCVYNPSVSKAIGINEDVTKYLSYPDTIIYEFEDYSESAPTC